MSKQKEAPLLNEIPDNCPKCGSPRVVDATLKAWHLPAVKCQICGWYKEIAIMSAKPMPKIVCPAEHIQRMKDGRERARSTRVPAKVIILRERQAKLTAKLEALKAQELEVMA